ncbi:response regulator transcription factor [Rhizosphaericola mali]|uniref:Response regulator transcription factor n=1 Tax=Rhizosphaericola mali TaxID=2545455 RepID=A0A5P2G4C6_9BACT|nr:response regulator transcription factor [Rhizosphaericola mali]QES90047.1 response regulator transcription factor [Rhizosphaericola mali]
MNGKKILIVEDELHLASLVSKVLLEEGFAVDIAYNGLQAYAQIQNGNYDLVLLDRMLPEMTGLDLCQKLRKEKNFIKILMLTALDSPEDIVQGLDIGADDYLTKPFSIKVLSARIRNLLRRDSKNDEETIKELREGTLLMDRYSKNVSRAEMSILLTPTEYKLLEYMLLNKHKVLSRMELLEHVWGIDFDMGTNVVDVYMNYLRKKVDKGFEPKIIQTIIGMGYMLKADYEN